ncbi:MAG: hypothetical protein ABIQ93_04970 [Saprospiraceae bacterium]
MPSPSIDLTDMNLDLGGGLTITIPDLTTHVVGDPARPVATLLTGDLTKPITTQLQGDPAKPIATLITGDPLKPVAMDLLNLPHFSLQDIKDLKTGRIHIPHYNQLCFKLFGINIFSFCLSGESQIISDHYVPNAYEKCEIPCCEIDDRPFPENATPGHN